MSLKHQPPPLPNQEKLHCLIDLAPKQCGVVQKVEAQDTEMERLMAMGVCTGRTVELVQQGDPLILKVYGTRIGVSSRLAERIQVEVCAKQHCVMDPQIKKGGS